MTTLPLTVFTERNFVADSSKEVDFCTIIGHFAFLTPLFLRGLEAAYDVYLRLIGKLVVDFLLVTIELFSLGVRAEAIRVTIHWKSSFFKRRGRQFGPKFQAEKDVPHHPFLVSENYITNLAHGIRMSAELTFVLSQCTRLTDRRADGRTDGFTIGKTACIQCSAVKTFCENFTQIYKFFCCVGTLIGAVSF